MAEEVDDAHRVGLQHPAQLGGERSRGNAGRAVQRHQLGGVQLDARAEHGALAPACRAAQLVLGHRLQPRRLTDLAVELIIVQRARAVLVDLVEDRINLAVSAASDKTEGLDRPPELGLADVARAVRVPCLEQIEHLRRRACERVLQGEHQELVHFDRAGVVGVERVKALLERQGRVRALFPLPYQRTELVKIERVVAPHSMRVKVHGVLPHSCGKRLLTVADLARHVVCKRERRPKWRRASDRHLIGGGSA